MNPVAIRLLNQQLIVPQFKTPTEVVSHIGAMQAQEYRMMRWAVAMRTKKPSHQAFKEAYDSGQIIRLHLMRGTWQLVSAEDYWWMIDLCAPKAIAVTKGWMHSNKISIPDEELYRVRDILIQAAVDKAVIKREQNQTSLSSAERGQARPEVKGSVTKEDFLKALAENNIQMDDHRLSYHIRMAEFSGTLCSGDLLPTKATYALSTEKVGLRPAQIDRDEALMRFTRKYFQSHQPATLDDFVWWSGLNVNDCRKGIALLGDAIHKETWKGWDFYLTDNCRTRGFRTGKLLLIPPYDEYLIGYKSRDIVLPPEHRHRAHNNNGIFQPIIACDGIICGNWSPFKNKDTVNFFLGEHAGDWQEEWTRYKTMIEK
ncbi:MAG: AlkZ family DNA glycosylase [Prevotella sp.]|nr:AlkZ family DNA glycosylase [Prevotella sp.]